MEFSIRSRNDNGLMQVLLVDEERGTEISILPQSGAMLHGFSVKTRQGLQNVIDNYPTAAELDQKLAKSFKSSKLSPFVCRIPGGKYNYAGKVLELQQKYADGNAIHGLLYNKQFVQTDARTDQDKATVTFEYRYNRDDAGYPFVYNCRIRYTLLRGNILELETTVQNLDDQAIPIADGWHPYFALGGGIDSWLLQFKAKSLVEFSEQLIPTGRLLPYTLFATSTEIGQTQLDNCFLLDALNNEPACTLENPATGLSLSIYPANGYPYLQIFTPPLRESIAIENLSAAPDAFNNGMGLIELAPEQSRTFSVKFQLYMKD